MSASEYRDWIQWYGEEPFGDVRADAHAGIIASTFANVMRGKGGKTYRPLDFMPFVRAQREADERDRPEVRARNMMLLFEGNLTVKVKRVKVPRARGSHGHR